MTGQKLFITGGTGFIGGSVLEEVVKTYPSLQITALLRSPTAKFKSRYPGVKILVGDFDASELIENASREADIVIHTGDIDHAGCAAAILSGMSKKTTPSFLIHLTGTGCIADIGDRKWEGVVQPRVWDDITDIQAIYDLPDTAFHHKIDKDIMNASNGLLRTVCISPPDVYGQSKGVGSRDTFLVPEYLKNVLNKKEAFYLGEGLNYRAIVHIDDLVDLFILILDQAIRGGGSVQWGKEGFYFGVGSEVQWVKVAEAINSLGVKKGVLPADSKATSWTRDQIASLASESEIDMPHLDMMFIYLWGSNSRAESARAKNLGWIPKAPSIWETLEEAMDSAIAKSQA